MEVGPKTWILYPSRSDVIELHNIADIHFGNKACHVRRCREDIAAIAEDPYAFWIGGGDYAEYIGPHDKRFDASCVADLDMSDFGSLGWALSHKVYDLFHPIAHKGLGLLIGNHEWKYFSNTDQGHMHGWLCDRLGLPNLGYCCFVDVVFVRTPRIKVPMLTRTCPAHGKGSDRFRVRIVAHHGFGSARTPGGKINKIREALNAFDCDVAFLAHMHDRKADRKTTITLRGKHIVERSQVGVISGSYLRTYAEGVSTYGEQKLYPPVTFGPASVRIRPFKREIKAEV